MNRKPRTDHRKPKVKQAGSAQTRPAREVSILFEDEAVIALNKPAGVVTSFGDNKNRATVYDCLKDLGRWVFPVGRLDMDTSGLLILTNDTDFSESLLQPESKVPKTYYVKVSGVVSPDEWAAIRAARLPVVDALRAT